MRIAIVLTAIVGVLTAGPARLHAEGQGQADLEEALRAKVTAEDVRQRSHVIELLESALDKGLDVENSDFAEQMLVDSLLERAEELATVLQRVPSEELVEPEMMEVRDMAASDLRRVLTYDNPPVQATAILAQVQALPGGDRREARRLLDKMFKSPGVESLPARQRAESLVLRASLQSAPEKAQADLDAAVELTPGEISVRLARAEFFRAQHKFDEALADVKAIIANNPDNPAAYLLQSQVERGQEKWTEALASLAKASELAPGATSPIQARGEIYRQQGDFQKAIDQFTQVLKLQPGNLLALVHRADAYLSSKQYAEALVDVEVVLKRQPALVVAHALRAQILASMERLPEAIEEMEKLAAAVPNDSEYKMQLALYYLVAEDPQKAIETYSKVLTNEADNYLALRSRGDAYLNIGDHADAVADFGKALAIKPEDSSLLNNYAWVLATSPEDKVRDGKRAIELATKAAELTKFEKPHILSTLAAAYAESGDFESAKKWSKKAVETRDSESTEEAAKEMAAQLSKELESYEANKPWRERLSVKKSDANAESESAPAAEGAASEASADKSLGKQTATQARP